MKCPGCGQNIDGLEQVCREEFNLAYGQHFHNLKTMRSHQQYWRGAYAGVVLDIFIFVFLLGLGGWSWVGFLEVVRLVSEKSYLLLLFPFLFPVVLGMTFDMLGSTSVNVEEEQAYQMFRAEWGGCKDKE